MGSSGLLPCICATGCLFSVLNMRSPTDMGLISFPASSSSKFEVLPDLVSLLPELFCFGAELTLFFFSLQGALTTRSLNSLRINVTVLLSTATTRKVPSVRGASLLRILSASDFSSFRRAVSRSNHRLRTLAEAIVIGYRSPACREFGRHQDVLLLTACCAASSDTVFQALLA